MLIIFNLSASIISFLKGNQQARLFILGFSIVFVSYAILMLDALGLISIVQNFPNTLIWGTTIEALILSLAFVDRYRILQTQKEEADKSRENIIKNEVSIKTAQLNKALKAKSLLLKEVHHRVKNNLQIILSMIRLQSDKITDRIVKEKFTNIENRINAIAKTYNMLIVDENLDDIDMEEYIEALLSDIEESMFLQNSNIQVETDISASLPLRKAVYIGIIVNELVTNSYKYAFDKKDGKISIKLYQKSQIYILLVSDNGKGFIYNREKESLGLKLIHTLILEQLKGKLSIETKNSSNYRIEFK
jgi:two-component sensor histidine kinase